jgi:hypothetical protein
MPETPEIPFGLDDLIKVVQSLTPEADPLAHLSDAVLLSDRLGELGDHLVGHFVDQARHAGASWSAIGSSLGVSKQAAQKRFVPGAGDLAIDLGTGRQFARLTPRARSTISAAQAEARNARRDEVATEHLLLGLLAAPGGLAAKALTDFGVTEDALRAKVAEVDAAAGVEPASSVPDKIPFTPQAKKVLELAVREALLLMHNYIGTEHLLLSIIAEGDGLGAQALGELGVTKPRASEWVVKTISQIQAQRATGDA